MTLAVNESWRLCPWADALYGGDAPWWFRHVGLPEFAGQKWTRSWEAATRYGLNFVECLTGEHRLVSGGRIGDGGNSGFQAINLAVNLGARLIALVGFDLRLDRGTHWHGAHEPPLSNPAIGHVVNWRRRLDAAAADIAARGVRVVNTSAVSALTAYPVLPLAEAIG